MWTFQRIKSIGLKELSISNIKDRKSGKLIQSSFLNKKKEDWVGIATWQRNPKEEKYVCFLNKTIF